MNKLINILSQGGHLVVTSRQISDDFEKEHRNVVRDIETLIANIGGAQNCADLFIEAEYQHPQNKQFYKEYLLTRDGFSLLVMGFTGSKALEWKLKYIEAFNKMEQALKNQTKPTCIEDVLIQSLQEMKAVKQTALEAKEEAAKSREEIQAMREAVTLDTNGWRKETATLINKIANKLGGFEHIRNVREESYKLLNENYCVDINRRLKNKQKNMALEGVSRSKINKVNVLDVIAEDKKLLNGYINIVTKMAIRYGVA